jgi:hypothetical protein
MKTYEGVEIYLHAFLIICTRWSLSSLLYAPAVSSPGIELPVPIPYEIVWAPELIWTAWRKEKSLFLAENRNTIARFHRYLATAMTGIDLYYLYIILK